MGCWKPEPARVILSGFWWLKTDEGTAFATEEGCNLGSIRDRAEVFASLCCSGEHLLDPMKELIRDRFGFHYRKGIAASWEEPIDPYNVTCTVYGNVYPHWQDHQFCDVNVNDLHGRENWSLHYYG